MFFPKRYARSISSSALIHNGVEAADKRATALLETEIAAYKAVFDFSNHGQQAGCEDAEIGSYAPIHRDDPSTWKSPNLDKLKASIRAEWMGCAAPA